MGFEAYRVLGYFGFEIIGFLGMDFEVYRVRGYGD